MEDLQSVAQSYSTPVSGDDSGDEASPDMNGSLDALENEVECFEEELEEVARPIEKVDAIHSRMRKELIPVVGMEFDTEDDAYDFYNRYAYSFGFSTRLSKAHKYKNGNVRDRIFVCSAEGKRGQDKRYAYIRSHRAETRFECLARMKIHYQLSVKKFSVVEFVAEHTHLTSTPRKTHFFRSHRKLSLAHCAQADMASDSGIAHKETLELMSRQAGGRENLGFIPEDYNNYLRSKRTIEMKSGDTGGVLEYLQRKQLEDPNFVYAIQVDEDDLITNIFWADAKMMVDYDYFGDVVSFDTTYRKNKDGRPFAMFVGVNNHKQTLIFGVALLYDETANTFIWLFDTFAKTMSGKIPKTILTDQDAAMAKALASQWPETHHRLCIWHIYQNAAKHLNSVFGKFKDFAKDFSSVVYDYEDVEDFLCAWQSMLEKYNLKENTWLSRLFELKEKWALVYGRQTFCADITTTQRSESMNSSIKKYVSYKYGLLRFFCHFQRLLDDRRYKELRADFKAIHTSPALEFPPKILRHAAKVYTPAVLKWFQVQLCKAHDCSLKLFAEVETLRIYEVTNHGKCFHHTVTFDYADTNISCTCKKFEFAGILCSHALKVFSENGIKMIPNQYISKRWTKEIKDKKSVVSSTNAANDDPKVKLVSHYRELSRLHTELASIAAESDETYEIAITGLHKILSDVKTCIKNKTTQEEIAPNTSKDGAHEVVSDAFGDHIVRGIKVKERIVHKNDSLRPKNALEKLTGNKRHKNLSSEHMEPELDHSNLNSAHVLATQKQVHSNQGVLQTFVSSVDSLNVSIAAEDANVFDSTLNIQAGETTSHPSSYAMQALYMKNATYSLQTLPPQMDFIPPFQYVQTYQPQYLRGYNATTIDHDSTISHQQGPATNDQQANKLH